LPRLKASAKRRPASSSSTTLPPSSRTSTWSSKNMQLSWVIGSSSRPRLAKALPWGEWAWAAACTSGRAACSAACSTKAARFTGQWPITTSPAWFTSSRSLTVSRRNERAKGFTQK
jgi:hypothetical protein